jgi:hypothetical protein
LSGRAASARTKQRLYRQRVRRQEAVHRVLVGPRVIEALIERGMSEAESRNREAVSRELSIVLQQWAERWLPD